MGPILRACAACVVLLCAGCGAPEEMPVQPATEEGTTDLQPFDDAYYKELEAEADSLHEVMERVADEYGMLVQLSKESLTEASTAAVKSHCERLSTLFAYVQAEFPEDETFIGFAEEATDRVHSIMNARESQRTGEMEQRIGDLKQACSQCHAVYRHN